MALLLATVTIVSCEKKNSAGSFTPTHDATGTPLEITVYTFDSRVKLWRHLRKNDIDKRNVEGLSQWTLLAKDNVVTRCDIYVVKPEGVKDYDTMTTWGHELVHCIYGSYHKDGER